jgi:hypothetical protein
MGVNLFRETPTITSSTLSAATYAGAVINTPKPGQVIAVENGGNGYYDAFNQYNAQQNITENMRLAQFGMPSNQPNHLRSLLMSRNIRLVQVFIVDTDENIPLDKAFLYQGTPKLTDQTDQELFFELDMRQLLADHNVVRIAVVDKKKTDRTVFLEPARIRDLKMSVVTMAQF